MKVKAKEQQTDYLVPEKNYEKFSYEFETTGKDSSDVEITLTGGGSVFVDNLSITELNSIPEILKEPEVEVPTDQEIINAHKEYDGVIDTNMVTGNVFINGLYFRPTDTNKEALNYINRYHVYATLEDYSGNGTYKDIGTRDKEMRNYGGNENQPKTNYINFRAYDTNLANVLTHKPMKIYAVTPDNREILVYDFNK